MLALAGYQLGIEFKFFDPNAGAPVGQIGTLIAADYRDTNALERFLDYVSGHERVWICRRVDIAKHWIATHPYAGVKPPSSP